LGHGTFSCGIEIISGTETDYTGVVWFIYIYIYISYFSIRFTLFRALRVLARILEILDMFLEQVRILSRATRRKILRRISSILRIYRIACICKGKYFIASAERRAADNKRLLNQHRLSIAPAIIVSHEWSLVYVWPRGRRFVVSTIYISLTKRRMLGKNFSISWIFVDRDFTMRVRFLSNWRQFSWNLWD